MSSVSYMVGNVSLGYNSSGKTYDATFFVKNADLASYQPVLGSSGYNLLGVSSTVTDVRRESIGDDWMVYITAAPTDETNTSVATKNPDELARYIEWNTSIKEIYLDPAWFGCIKCDSATGGASPFRTVNASGTQQYDRLFYYRFYSIKNTDTIAKPGDFIYKNAVPKIMCEQRDTNDFSLKKTTYADADLMSKGSMNFELCPYNITTISPDLVGVKHCKTVVYSVTYYVQSIANLMWQGLNGSIPGRLAPPVMTSYKWLAVDQTLSSTKDSEGNKWIKVTRKMEAAPGNLTWKLSKCLAGVWTWY